MVESLESIKRSKRVYREKGRGRGGRCLHHGEVGDDILVDILARLPLKSIFRFKCVSKRWQQLISKDYFRARIIERNKMNLNPLYFFQTPRVYLKNIISKKDIITKEEEPSPTRWRHDAWSLLAEAKNVTNSSCPSTLIKRKRRNKFRERVEVDSDVLIKGGGGGGIVGGDDDFRFFICSCNGLLLCLVSHWINSRTPCCRFRYYIYNPLTKVGYLLPHSPKQSQRGQLNLRILCQFGLRDCVGLVVDDDMDGYKVVRVEASLTNENIIELETFSSHTGEWHLSTVTVSVDTHKCFSRFYAGNNYRVCVIKGAIYWMVGDLYFEYIVVYNDDMEEEHHSPSVIIEMIKTPPYSTLLGYRTLLGCVGMGESVDGLLQVAVVEKEDFRAGDSVIKIWVYHPQAQEEEEEDCSRWFLRRELTHPLKLAGHHLQQVVISFHPTNPDILFICRWGCIFACHLNTSPLFVESLVRFKLQDYRVSVQPYLPPPWPISPFPTATVLPRKNNKGNLLRA